MDRTLTFDGTLGKGKNATLTIDRTGLLDLSYFFRNYFNRIDEGRYHSWNSERWSHLDEKKAVMNFDNDELFNLFLGVYDPKDFANFLEDNMLDPREFHNNSLLTVLRQFDQFHRRVYYHEISRHFVLEPLASKERFLQEISEIEKIVKPNFTGKDYGSDEVMCRYNINCNTKNKDVGDELGNITTRPYRKSTSLTVLSKLKLETNRPIYIVREGGGWDLSNPFEFLRIYSDMPTDHLKVVRK